MPRANKSLWKCGHSKFPFFLSVVLVLKRLVVGFQSFRFQAVNLFVAATNHRFPSYLIGLPAPPTLSIATFSDMFHLNTDPLLVGNALHRCSKKHQTHQDHILQLYLSLISSQCNIGWEKVLVGAGGIFYALC
jgi:hypothetical protein